MKAPGIKAADAAVWSNTWNDSRPSGSQGEGGEGSGKGKAAAPHTRADEMTFSRKLEQRLLEKDSGDAQVRQLLDLVEDSNDKMRDILQSIRPLKVETTPVPFVIGLPIDAAASKLKASELKISGVSQEYSLTVPEGHVVSQAPGPGSRSVKRGGIRLLISKGLPPEKERRDPIRQREKAAPLPDSPTAEQVV